MKPEEIKRKLEHILLDLEQLAQDAEDIIIDTWEVGDEASNKSVPLQILKVRKMLSEISIYDKYGNGIY